ncbi:carboxylating nicotinate-nucleotide diphosphorylase [Candidatus Roizmanbacteria bacterium]|nr:carboxylating nicotinate-nucleotide diphosphorylase [Candidatus Roizmanbacteria bacterium]
MKNHSILQFFQKKDQLTLDNKAYKKLVDELFVWLLKSDKVTNDISSKNLFTDEKIISACIITREMITVAGLEEIEYLIKNFTDLQTNILCLDGDEITPGQSLLKINGDIREVLAYERTILNILQRMCGIATETQNIVNKISDQKPFIAATRKTIWGLLDKKAVAMGGGLTHRLDLSDGILIKDNHLMFMSATDTLSKLLKQVNNTLIEIEVEDKTTLFELIKLFNQKETKNVLTILLDNFYTKDVTTIMSKIDHQANIIFEASGGITKDNITDWAQTGVDIISLGSLTHSTKSSNLSLEILGPVS